jgi:hypothetical protein
VKSFEKAETVDLARRPKRAGRKRAGGGKPAVFPLFQGVERDAGGLVTGGNDRLARALRKDALDTFVTVDVESS